MDGSKLLRPRVACARLCIGTSHPGFVEAGLRIPGRFPDIVQTTAEVAEKQATGFTKCSVYYRSWDLRSLGSCRLLGQKSQLEGFKFLLSPGREGQRRACQVDGRDLPGGSQVAG